MNTLARTRTTQTLHHSLDLRFHERSKVTHNRYQRHTHEPYYRLHFQRGPCRKNWLARYARHFLAAALVLSLTLGTHTHAQTLPECTIKAVVGSDFTQIDVIWPDASEVTEYAYPSQWQAAQRVSMIEQEFACNVEWQNA